MRYRAQLEKHFGSKGEMKIKELAEYILENDTDINLKKSSLVEYLRTIKRENKAAALVVDGDSYTVEMSSDAAGNKIPMYHWKDASYTVEFIDNLFTFYSRKGYNFTRMKAQLKFGLTPKAWGQIARQFNMSKDCDILSPWTLSNTPKGELENIIQSKIDKILSSGEMTTQRYNDSVTRKHRRVIEAANLGDAWENEVLADLIEQLPRATKINVPVSKANKIQDLVTGITDLHSGAKFKGNLISEDYSLVVFKEKLRNAVILSNAKEAKNNHLLIAGDIVEAINMMHENQFKGIEEEGFGVGIVFQTYEILVEEVFNKLHNLKSISLVSGNHDRDAPSNKNMNSAAVDILVYLIRQQFALSNVGIEVNYHPDILGIDFPGFGVITAHGHKGLHKREGSFLVENFAVDRNKYQFILTGHFHTFVCKQNDDTFNHIKLIMPSIVTANSYSDLDIGRSARSGVTFCYVNAVGEPTFSIERI